MNSPLAVCIVCSISHFSNKSNNQGGSKPAKIKQVNIQQTITCSKLTKETLKEGVKYVRS